MCRWFYLTVLKQSCRITSKFKTQSSCDEGGFVVPVAKPKTDISKRLQIELWHHLKPKKNVSLKKHWRLFDLCLSTVHVLKSIVSFLLLLKQTKIIKIPITSDFKPHQGWTGDIFSHTNNSFSSFFFWYYDILLLNVKFKHQTATIIVLKAIICYRFKCHIGPCPPVLLVIWRAAQAPACSS